MTTETAINNPIIKPVIETLEVVKCTTGYIIYLHDGRGEVVATRAVHSLGTSSYKYMECSVMAIIEEAFS